MLKMVWRFRAFMRPYRWALLLGSLLVLVETAFDLAQPWPLKVIIDGAISHKPQEGWFAQLIAGSHSSPEMILIRAMVTLVLATVLSDVLDFTSDYVMSNGGERVTIALRQAVFSHLQRLSLSYHDRQRVGDLVSRVTLDIDRLQNMMVSIFDTTIPSVVMLAGLALVMLWTDFTFGLLALSIAPLLFLVVYRYTPRIKRAVRSSRQADAQVAAQASETLAAVRWVQAFTREEREEELFEQRNRQSLVASLRAIRLKAAYGPVVDVVSLIGTVLVTYFGARQVIDGQMTLGVLTVFLSYLRSLYRPMRALARLAYTNSLGVTSGERVLEVLDVQDEVTSRPGARRMTRPEGAVELRDVVFRYAPELAPVLRGASFSVRPGEHVGIMGRTGAGKSTLASLIPRFYDPECGAVLIDGWDVRELELESLRHQVSLVLQEPIIFYGTILDNVRYGDPEASIKRVRRAMEAANVTEFLERLPDGMLSVVGERGATLSGGQRQRIAIARAILRDAPILILDEPTTGLDRETEGLVLQALENATRGRTTLWIAHDPNVLRNMDRLVRVDGGVITDMSPLSLVAAG